MTRPTGAWIRRPAVQKILGEPLTHFLLLGGALFLLYAAVQGRDDDGAGDRPALARGRVLRLQAADLENLRSGYAAAWKREPTAPELADLVQNFLSEEILFREAAALGLDADDEVVRRRLIEKMTVLVRPSGSPGEPNETVLRRWYQTYSHRFRQPARIGFEQLYFDPKLRADAAGAARAALAQLAGGEAGKPPPAGVGDSFVLPATMSERTDTQVAHLYGSGFAAALFAAPIGSWSGPIASNFGAHLVRVTRRDPERLPSFEEARPHVRADWLTAETRGVRAAAENLLPRYRIEVDPEIRDRLQGAPALTPFLLRAR
jgi:hypothetical protein